MTITIDSVRRSIKTELTLAPISADTTITLEQRSKHTFIHQNDEVIEILPFSYPIMKIVKAIRRAIPNAKLQLI